MMSHSSIRSKAQVAPSAIVGQTLMEVELGVPSKKCKNFGICKVSPIRGEFEIQAQRDRKSIAMVTILDEHIEIDFMKRSLSPFTYKEFFKKQFFLVEETVNFQFDNDDQINFTIVSGEYPILENNSTIKVIFKEGIVGVDTKK